jgi:hypothetical protein
VARFSELGHTPRRVAAPASVLDPELPFTLDLRRSAPRG